MPTDHHARYAAESRSSEELAACFLREGWETDAGIHAMVTIHYRGGQTEFDLGRRHTQSADAAERAMGAEIIGDLGWEKKHFQDESVSLLLDLLHDPEAKVLRCAAIALGHRHEPRSIPALLTLLEHPDAGVRFGVCAGLSGHDDLAAIAGLIRLSRDPDDGTRDWATFGLGKQTSLDTPELRDALVARLTDADPEIRGEALMGLGAVSEINRCYVRGKPARPRRPRWRRASGSCHRGQRRPSSVSRSPAGRKQSVGLFRRQRPTLRKDDRVRPALEAALRGPFHGDWPLEAVEHLASPAWIPLVELHRQNADPEDAARFASSFDSALAACRQGATATR